MANGFVNDLLKWQRLRIESLEKELSKEKKKKKLFLKKQKS